MGVVVRFPRHARASSAGQRSGRSSDRWTPVSRSIASANSAGTPFLERVSQYQTCDCVLPIRAASSAWLPATLHARRSASVVDMPPEYLNIGENQPRNMWGTGNLDFVSHDGVGKKVDKSAFAARVRSRMEKLRVRQSALAQAIDVDYNTLGNVLQGRVEQPKFIEELAEALHTTRKWLLWKIGPEDAGPPPAAEDVHDIVEQLPEGARPVAAAFLRRLIRDALNAEGKPRRPARAR